MTERLLSFSAWTAVAICVIPILAAAVSAFTGDLETWSGMEGMTQLDGPTMPADGTFMRNFRAQNLGSRQFWRVRVIRQ